MCGDRVKFGVVGTVLDPARKRVGSLHCRVLAWGVGWMGNLQILEIRVVRSSQSAESGFPGGASPPEGW